MSEHASVIRVSRHYPADGRRDEVASVLNALAEAMRKAPGCFGAQVVLSDRDSEPIILISRWESTDAMARFGQQPDFTVFQRQLQSSLEGPPEIEIFTTA